MKVFTSRDPYPGRTWKPSTLHGYSYVENDPINKVDPTGLCAEVGNEACSIYDRLIAKYPELANVPVLPNLSESELRRLEQLHGNVPTDGYYHTENYGSYDSKHITPGKSDFIMQNVQTAIGLPAGHMFPIAGNFEHAKIGNYQVWYWVSGEVKPEQVHGIALAIQMDYERRWEFMQNRIPYLGTNSSFASEDLPSDYLGFYLATQGFDSANSRSLAVAFAQLGGYTHNDHASPLFGDLHNWDEGVTLYGTPTPDDPMFGLLRNYYFLPMNGSCWPENMQINPIHSTSGLWKFVEDITTGFLGPFIGDLD